jgi:predicted nucleotidyltransferase
MKDKKIIQKIKSALEDSNAYVSIYLYGSRARGDAHPLSDWDLLIIMNNNDLNADIEDKIFSEIYKIELETGQIISPYFLNRNVFEERLGASPFYRNISKESILL